MRSTVEIICAVKDNEPATEEELRLCIVVMSNVEHFIKHDLQGLIDAIRERKSPQLIKMKAEFAYGTIERMFSAVKKSPVEWLSVDDIPGTPENMKRRLICKKIFKKATGLDL